MAYEASDVLRALGAASASPLAQAKRAESAPGPASSLLRAMRTQSAAGPGGEGSDSLPPRSAAAFAERASQKFRVRASAVRAGEIAAGVIERTLSSHRTSPATSVSPGSPISCARSDILRQVHSLDSRRASVDSSHGRPVEDVKRGMNGFQEKRDKFSHAEFHGRPSSRTSSRSGGYLNAGSGHNSPVIASRHGRKERQEMLSELTSSSDDDSPNKRRGAKKSTRNVLRSLDLHASDMGSSDGSPSPRNAAPSMTVDPRTNSSREMHFTTSSTDEDKRLQRAWESHAPQPAKVDYSSASPVRSLRQRYRRDGTRHSPESAGLGGKTRTLNDSGSSDNAVEHENVLESAMSVVRGLEHCRMDAENIEHLQQYLSRSRGHSPSERSRTSPAKSLSQRAGPLVCFCSSRANPELVQS